MSRYECKQLGKEKVKRKNDSSPLLIVSYNKNSTMSCKYLLQFTGLLDFITRRINCVLPDAKQMNKWEIHITYTSHFFR